MPLYHAHLESPVMIPVGQDGIAERKAVMPQLYNAPLTPVTGNVIFQYGRRRFVALPSEDSDDWDVSEEVRRNLLSRMYRRIRRLEDPEYKVVHSYDVPDDQERVYMGELVSPPPSELYPRQDTYRRVHDVLWHRHAGTHVQAPAPKLLDLLPVG